jgi:hypothetical protein
MQYFAKRFRKGLFINTRNYDFLVFSWCISFCMIRLLGKIDFWKKVTATWISLCIPDEKFLPPALPLELGQTFQLE